MTPIPFVVLMAEDDEHDILATKRAWSKHKLANPLHIVTDGEMCMDYLLHKGAYADPASAPRPGLVLLDINMPRLSGLEVLKLMRDHETLRRLPVVILTSSKEEEDRMKSYDLGANAYIVKPVGFDNFSDAVRTINMFWQLVELSPEK